MAYVEVDRWEGMVAQVEAAPPSPWEPLGGLIAMAALAALAMSMTKMLTGEGAQ